MSPTFQLTILFALITALGCTASSGNDSTDASGPYTGTASVTQGAANTTVVNLFPPGIRVTGLGEIRATDSTDWMVPAPVAFTDDAFPFASDLHNQYGATYTSAAAAVAALDGSDIVEVDTDGEVITGYLFADNYFELYINGVAVGKDRVPFTEFNSSIVRFRVARPFTIAMKLVDWEENLGLGSEGNRGAAYHPGDGGLVAVFKDASDAVVAITGRDWKAQTFYTAPIRDLSCPTETGTTRSTADCSTADSNNGEAYYGLHWKLDAGWEREEFDDSSWPDATTYTNEQIGVDNKPSYTNFTDVFDDASNDAEFIWSTNVILDNLVIVRYRME